MSLPVRSFNNVNFLNVFLPVIQFLDYTMIQFFTLKSNLSYFVSESEEHHQRPPWVVTPGGVELTPSPPHKDGVPLPPTKPRIWSMAELAVSKPSYGVGCG